MRDSGPGAIDESRSLPGTLTCFIVTADMRARQVRRVRSPIIVAFVSFLSSSVSRRNHRPSFHLPALAPTCQDPGPGWTTRL